MKAESIAMFDAYVNTCAYINTVSDFLSHVLSPKLLKGLVLYAVHMRDFPPLKPAKNNVKLASVINLPSSSPFSPYYLFTLPAGHRMTLTSLREQEIALFI